MKKLLITSAVMIALSSGAHADVQISMQPGSECWSYQGLDTRFFGSFSSGQALTIAVVEEQANEKGGMEAVAYDAEKIWVNGPDHYYRDGNREDPNDRVIFTESPAAISTTCMNTVRVRCGRPGIRENLCDEERTTEVKSPQRVRAEGWRRTTSIENLSDGVPNCTPAAAIPHIARKGILTREASKSRIRVPLTRAAPIPWPARARRNAAVAGTPLFADTRRLSRDICARLQGQLCRS
jgi:hypothetical protein